MKTTTAIFSKNVRKYRELSGLTQAQLSEKVGISINFLSTIEGTKRFPSPAVIDRFAGAFEISVYQLFVDWDRVDGIGDELIGKTISKAFLEGLENEVMRYAEKFFKK
jgi:transcriptional regulator with XRE-family HTH domain